MASEAFKTISGMAQSFIACDREQAFLMPPDVRDWLPESHLAWFVLEAVAAMDLTAFYAACREDGRCRPAYEPSMMVTLLLYAYARGVRSARAIERACEEDVAYRVIAAHTKPDHATIARFVERHEQALAGLFGAVLGLCAQAGLAKVEIVAIDGTKVQATLAATPRATTSRSPGRSSRRPRPSTRPRTSSTAKRAATNCRPSWPAPRVARSGCAPGSASSMTSAQPTRGRSRARARSASRRPNAVSKRSCGPSAGLTRPTRTTALAG
jgi:transposase